MGDLQEKEHVLLLGNECTIKILFFINEILAITITQLLLLFIIHVFSN